MCSIGGMRPPQGKDACEKLPLLACTADEQGEGPGLRMDPVHLNIWSHVAGSSGEPVDSVESSYTAEASSLPWESIGLLLCDVITVLMCLAALHVWVYRWMQSARVIEASVIDASE